MKIRGDIAVGSMLMMFATAGAALATGPDLRVAEVTDVFRWGTRDGWIAYSVGTIVCNQGDQIAAWDRFTPAHPVIAQNMVRVANGRIEQIGVSWVKHGFSADLAPYCGTCTTPPNYNGQQLGIGCADAYTAGLNGELWTLGPRSPINPATGVFPFPVDFTGIPAATPTIGRRIQVRPAAVDPAQNPGARYFAECQFVAADEAQAGNSNDSTSYREFVVNPSNFNWTVAPGAPTRVSTPMIYAWREVDPDVRVEFADIPGDGRVLLASRVTPLGGGLWRYVYAVQNLTSDLAVASVEVPWTTCPPPTPPAVTLPAYHSGEAWSNDHWQFAQSAGRVVWATPQSHAQSATASALRWGTLATIEITADRPPVEGSMVLGLFKPNPTASITIQGFVPGRGTDVNADGFVDFFDYDDYVAGFELGNPATDFNGDGFLDFFDFDDFVQSFEEGC
jgi:hypothetical protein